jgi:hypothetical protein
MDTSLLPPGSPQMPMNMSAMPQAPLPMSPMQPPMQPAPMQVPFGVDPALWLQLKPEQQLQFLNIMKGMESAKPGMPLYGPAAPREVPTPSMEPPRKETESFKF